jgi:hypothetical protein
MIDGFGPNFGFAIRDSAAVDNLIAGMGARRSGADNSGRLVFSTFSAGTETEKMTIMPSGNVGIGTTTPGQKLNVIGGAGDDIIAKFQTTGTGTSNYSEIHIANNADDRTVLGSIGSNYTNENWANSSYLYSTGAGRHLYLKTLADMHLFTGGTVLANRRLSILSNGNVGIGTTSPGAKLDVNGNTNITGNLTVTNLINKPTADSVVITQNDVPILSTFKATGTDGENTFIGRSGNTTLTGSTTGTQGSYNTAIGQGALTSLTVGSNNVAVGNSALKNNTEGDYNVAVGQQALRDNNTGYFNTAVGQEALRNNTSGFRNTAMGLLALSSNTTGQLNTSVGVAALTNNTSGNFNTAIGDAALNSNTLGSENTAVGREALEANTTGGNNNAVGRSAGYYAANGTTENATGSNSIFIGNNTRPLGDNQTNQVVIGHTAIGIGSNTVTLGNDSIVTTALKGNVGIGTTSPGSKLDVVGNIILGTQANRATITYPTNIARTFTIPNPGANAEFVMTQGSQAIDGDKVFTGNLIIGSSQDAALYTDPGNDDLIITNAAGNILLESNGSVSVNNALGIGTLSPSTALHVVGSIRTRAAATASASTQIPVFTANPASTEQTIVTRTPAQLLSDIGAAASSHTHGNISNTGAIGTTANQVVYTTTSGILTTITAVPGSNGGTGLTTFGAAGRILYSTSASALATLTAGAAGQILQSNGTSAPSWIYPGSGLLAAFTISATANTYSTVLDTPSLAAGTYFVEFEGAFAKSNTTSSTLIFSARIGTLNNATLRGDGAYSIADNTTFTAFLLNHSSATDGAANTGFTTAAITAIRNFSRIKFSGFLRVTTATNLLIRVAAGSANAGYTIIDGSTLSVTRLA